MKKKCRDCGKMVAVKPRPAYEELIGPQFFYCGSCWERRRTDTNKEEKP
jgi:hypothetical protein